MRLKLVERLEVLQAQRAQEAFPHFPRVAEGRRTAGCHGGSAAPGQRSLPGFSSGAARRGTAAASSFAAFWKRPAQRRRAGGTASPHALPGPRPAAQRAPAPRPRAGRGPPPTAPHAATAARPARCPRAPRTAGVERPYLRLCSGRRGGGGGGARDAGARSGPARRPGAGAACSSALAGRRLLAQAQGGSTQRHVARCPPPRPRGGHAGKGEGLSAGADRLGSGR